MDEADATPALVARSDTTHEDLWRAYDGPTGSQPNGVRLTTEEQEAKWQTFLDSLRDGTTVRNALKKAGVAWGSLCRWIAADERKAVEYARAREEASDVWADRAVVYAMQAKDKDSAAAARVKADVAKWRAAVQSPRWNDRADTNIAVQVNVSTNQVMMDQLRRRNLSD